MRRHPSIGIDLQRRQMKNRLLNRCVGRGLESAIEEADVGRELFGLGVCRRDHDCHAWPASRPARNGKRLRRRRQSAVIGTVRSRPAVATARARIERSVREGVLMLIGDRLAESS